MHKSTQNEIIMIELVKRDSVLVIISFGIKKENVFYFYIPTVSNQI